MPGYASWKELYGLEYLQLVNVAEVVEIRYLRPTTATQRFGQGHEGGVIHIVTRES